MIGPRNTVVRALAGEMVTMDDVVRDHSPFIDSRMLSYWDTPELWIEKIYEGYYEDLES